MAEPARGDKPLKPKDKTFFERLLAFMTREPDSREDLLNALHEAHRRDLRDADAMSMIEGVRPISDASYRKVFDEVQGAGQAIESLVPGGWSIWASNHPAFLD